MKKIFNIVLSLLLVLPVVAVAMPCNMQMEMQEVQPQTAMNGEMPCMNHQQKVMENCDNVMSMADCYDLELLSSVDKVKIPLNKVDVPSVALLVDNNWQNSSLATVQSRAPPTLHAHVHSPLSVILTTQRFRV